MAVELVSLPFNGNFMDDISGAEAAVNGSAVFAAGVAGGAVFLNGEDSYVDVSLAYPRGASKTLDAYTVAFWQYGNGEPNREAVLMEAYGDGQAAIRIMMAKLVDGEPRVYIEHMGETAHERTAPCFYLGGWNHWAFTVCAAAKSVTIYRNGQIVCRRRDAEITPATVGAVRIGADRGGALAYAGRLCDFKIYMGALGLEEIRAVAFDGRAYAPSPANAASLFVAGGKAQKLRWSGTAERFDVYVGSSRERVSAAGKNAAEYKGTVDVREFSPKDILEGEAFYWRIDMINGDKTTKGLPWMATARVFSGEEYAAWGQETIDAIERDFREQGSRGYREDSKSEAPAFAWPNSIYIMALSSAEKACPGFFTDILNGHVSEMDKHLTEYNGLLGYDVSALREKTDRFYDDNSWLSIAFCDAYEATGEAEHLRRAVLAYDFTVTGETPDLGGGIWWKETYYENDPMPEKAISATAGAAHAAAKLYAVTGEGRYLSDFERLSSWIYKNLKDEDGLILNSIYENGETNYVKWAYNTAVPALANLRVYEKTGEARYLEAALQAARDAARYWTDTLNGAVADVACFGFTLTDLYVGLYKATGDLYWLGLADACLRYVRSTRDDYGRYAYHPITWNADRQAEYKEYGLLFTAPNARAFWTMAAIEKIILSEVLT